MPLDALEARMDDNKWFCKQDNQPLPSEYTAYKKAAHLCVDPMPYIFQTVPV